MALSIRHKFHSGKPTGPDATKVQGPHWDDDHAIVDSVTGLPLGASATLVPVATIVDYAGVTAPAGWLECAGQLLASATYPALYAALVKIQPNVTITIGAPAVITWAAHGLPIGSIVTFGTNGALPTGIVAGTKYYVHSAGYVAGSFRIAPTIEGTVVNTTGTQSGTHFAVHAPFGAAGTDFNLPDLREVVTAGASIAEVGGVASAKLASSYATGEFLGTETVALSIANMPAHDHTAATGSNSIAHTHALSGSGSGSGSTAAADLTHGHSISDPFGTLIEQSTSRAQGSGSNKFAQPSDAGGGTNQYYSAAAVNLNHAHSFSITVSVSGSATSTSIPHTHTISSQGSGTAHSNVQPTIFIRKIIYAGV